MSIVARSVALVVSAVLLSACGGGGALNNPYAYQQYGQQSAYGQSAYGSQYTQAAYGQSNPGQAVYGQTGMMQQGSAQYGQMANGQMSQAYGYTQQNQQSNLNAPIGGDYGYYPENNQVASQNRTAPTTTRATTPTRTSSTVSGTKTTTATKTTTTRTATSAKTAAPTAAKAPAAADYLAKARQALGSVQSLSATIATFEKGQTAGQGKIQYLYGNGQIKIDVVSSSDSSRQGVKIAYQAGGASQVKVRPSGLLKMMSLSLSMSDPKVLSGRKYQVGQIDLSATVNRLTQPGVQAKVLGKTTFAGSEVIVLEITVPNPFDNRITKEHLGLDAKNFLPRIHEMYEGQELVYAGRVEQLTVNPPLAANAFEV